MATQAGLDREFAAFARGVTSRGPRAGFIALIAFALVLLFAPVGSADSCSYCSTFIGTCCGDVGQLSCAGFGGKGCNYDCKDGLHYNSSTAHCEENCSYCTNFAGGCCGDVGQVSCAGTAGSSCNYACKDGLHYNSSTAHCELPCSYCTNFAGGCCGDTGQVSCAGTGGSGCNFACKTGLRFQTSAASCQPFDSSCTYCQTTLGNCCGGVGDPSCAGLGQQASGASCNYDCSDSLHYDSSGVCAPAATPATTYLNGSDQRPFYIWAHNPNTPGKIEADLAAGANALEPDITVAHDKPCTTFTSVYDETVNDLVDSDSSSPYRAGLCYDTHFADWLDYVHGAALRYPQLAMIASDIKSSAADSAHVRAILTAIRKHLTYDLPTLNIILSVGSLDDAQTAFAGSYLGAADLGPTEGVQIDAEDDPAKVHNFFVKNGYQNFSYGNGSALGALDLNTSGKLTRALDKAAFFRASVGHPQLVSYAYLLNAKDEMDSFIKGGADGIIPGHIGSVAFSFDPACAAYYSNDQDTALLCYASPIPTSSLDVNEIKILAQLVNDHSEIRLATRDDNPWQPKLQSYGLEVSTPANASGDTNGTDANLTFTLNGCKGSSLITINAGDVIPVVYTTGRMEAGNTDHVTIPSKDLGKLDSITIYNDGTGPFPSWTFQDLKISSAGYFGWDYDSKYEYKIPDGTHVLDRFKSLSLTLTPNFTVPSGLVWKSAGGRKTIACPQTPQFITPTAGDVCDDNPTVQLVSDVKTPTRCNEIYTETRTWVATNSQGQSSTPLSETVDVIDIEAPVFDSTPAPKTVECGHKLSFQEPHARDACDPKPMLSFKDEAIAGACAGTFSQTRTWTASDCSGNVSQPVSQTITVVDSTPPALAGQGAPATLECPALPVFTAPTASDACDASPLISFTDRTIPAGCPGTYSQIRSWQASDCSGNVSAAVSQTMTVVDTTPPQIVCPANLVVDAATAEGAKVAFSVTAGDSCDVSVALSYSRPPGSVFPIGTDATTSTATDCSGNRSSCQFTATVRGPRSILSDVLVQLGTIQPQGGRDRDEGLELLAHARRELTDAIDSRSFIDDTHVQPRAGEHVFDAIRESVEALEALVRNDDTVGAAVAEQVAREVRASRILAEIALPGAAGRQLAEAQRELTEGDEAVAKGSMARAVDEYASAWERAARSAQHARRD